MTFVFTAKHVLTHYVSYSSKICVSTFSKTNVSDSGPWLQKQQRSQAKHFMMKLRKFPSYGLGSVKALSFQEEVDKMLGERCLGTCREPVSGLLHLVVPGSEGNRGLQTSH